MSAARTAASLRSGPGTSISDASLADSLADAKSGPKLARAFCAWIGHPKASIKRFRQSTAIGSNLTYDRSVCRNRLFPRAPLQPRVTFQLVTPAVHLIY